MFALFDNKFFKKHHALPFADEQSTAPFKKVTHEVGLLFVASRYFYAKKQLTHLIAGFLLKCFVVIPLKTKFLYALLLLVFVPYLPPVQGVHGLVLHCLAGVGSGYHAKGSDLPAR